MIILLNLTFLRRYRFNVTLFGSFVEELTSFVSSREAANAVIVLLFCKVKLWQGIHNRSFVVISYINSILNIEICEIHIA